METIIYLFVIKNDKIAKKIDLEVTLSDQKILDYFHQTTTLKETTKAYYVERLEEIRSHFFEEPKTLWWILFHPDQFQEALLAYGAQHQYNSNSIAMYPRIMTALFKHFPVLKERYAPLCNRWQQLTKVIEQPIDQQIDSNQPNERQKQALIPYDHLLTIMKGLPIGSVERLLMALYLLIPPVRNDYWNLQITLHEPSGTLHNYLVWGEGQAQIILNDYKTSKRYGAIRITLPPELIQIFKETLTDFSEGAPVFLTPNWKPFQSAAAFDLYANRLLRKVTGNQHFSLTVFRHAFLSRPELGLEQMTLGQKKDLARSMGHNTVSQNGYQWMLVNG